MRASSRTTRTPEHFNGDGGVSGNGFYLKSRAIEVTDNTAQSSARAGFMWHTEGGEIINPDADKLGEFGVTANHTDTIAAERVPIMGFEGNETIAAQQGIRILASPSDSVRKFNDVYSHLKDFTAWEIDSDGVSVTYSSKYIFEDFLILGTEEKQTDEAQSTNSGFYFKASVADITVLNSHVENFHHAVTNWTQVGDRQEYRRGYWDPKTPYDNPWVEEYEGVGHVEGIENAAWNLWNTNVHRSDPRQYRLGRGPRADHQHGRRKRRDRAGARRPGMGFGRGRSQRGRHPDRISRR